MAGGSHNTSSEVELMETQIELIKKVWTLVTTLLRKWNSWKPKVEADIVVECDVTTLLRKWNSWKQFV